MWFYLKLYIMCIMSIRSGSGRGRDIFVAVKMSGNSKILIGINYLRILLFQERKLLQT